MKKRKKLISGILSLFITICLLVPVTGVESYAAQTKIEGVTRLSGATRYETGYKVADELKEQLGVKKFDAVIVATGKNFADALAGSYLAVQKNAPIILTNGKADNIAQLHKYIKENVTTGGKVYILGGTGAVPAAVEVINGYDVVRLSGKSRYETNLAILEEAGVEGTEMIVATGKTFADSLSASATKLPILLVKPDTALTDEVKTIAEGMNKFYIIGGEGAVSADIAAELAAYGEVVRVSGKTRYETSVAVAKTFFSDIDAAVAASAKTFPDGLCGGPLAAAINEPLILTADGKTDAAEAYMSEMSVKSGFVLGGTGALSDETVVTIFGLGSVDDIIDGSDESDDDDDYELPPIPLTLTK
ncbi:MAG: cell wall-binding repeat-containing protein [Lachnospiraceae bacterium]|nr:cell wall-binding repeat-containing protein [Lachnospiraceae bacterium]